MNYQYRYGTTTTQAIRTLHADGGWTRFYQGITVALVQGPVARFGDTAANVGILALLQSNPFMSKLPTLVKTIFASLAAAGFRIVLTPIDTLKTTLQTQGREGIPILRNRVSLKKEVENKETDNSHIRHRSGNMALARCGMAQSQPPPQLS